MTTASPRTAPTSPTHLDALTIIEHTYPAWHIRQRRGMWTARRTTPPTPDQAEAGLLEYIVRPNPEDLAAILGEQLLIAQTVRAG